MIKVLNEKAAKSIVGGVRTCIPQSSNHNQCFYEKKRGKNGK